MTKRNNIILALLLLAPLNNGCLAYKWAVATEPVAEKIEKKPLKVVEKPLKVLEKPSYIHVDKSGDQPNHFKLKNTDKIMAFVDYNSSVVDSGGRSIQVVSGQTKVVHEDQGSIKTPIAPGTSVEVSFYPVDKSDTLVLTVGIATYHIAIQRGSSIDYLVVEVTPTKTERRTQYKEMTEMRTQDKDKTVVTRASAADRWGCYITSIVYGGWCWFVRPSSAERLDAERIAQTKFGATASVEYKERVEWHDEYAIDVQMEK